MMKRPHKMFALSLASHTAAAALLWFAALDLVAVEMPAPTVIETTILPPPVAEVTPLPTPKVVEVAPKMVATKKPSSVPDKPINSDGAGATKESTKPVVGGDGKATAEPAATVEKMVKGVPVDAPIKDGGFQIKYDVTANYKGMDAAGGAVFTFNRTGSTYKAELSSHASVAKFNATSEGEIRDNTVATTRFKDGRTIGLLGMGKERGGSNFMVDYVAHAVNFDGANGAVSPLAYDAVYDYLSAMVYIQALLQSKQGRVASLQLPIGKRTSVEMARVTFQSAEHLSTMEGAFEDAIPATIVIPSGSIKSIKMWFVPEKKYRPLQIEIGFNSGNVKLISRESN